MKLIYKGKYEGIVEEFESAKKVKNATKYKEADSLDEMAKIITIPANVLQILLLVIVFFIIGINGLDDLEHKLSIMIFAFLVSLLTMVPHELLHGICYRGDVYFYTNLKQLMLFIVGEEHLSKWKFIFMSLLPNLLFGFIPFIIFLFNSKLIFLGFLGAICISYGMGDYYNVWNTLRQVPKGGMVFAKGHNSYWYVPDKEKSNEK